MPRILVVDDDPQGLYMLEALLKAHGYDIDTAVNGVEALEKARARPPDMIISDFFMPTMDGFALCRECKMDNRLKEIPFIAYTATFTSPKDEELALRLGAARFLVKPLDPSVLLKEVQQVLADAQTGRLPPPPEPVSEAEHLREYNNALIRKLEAKISELVEEMEERKKAEVNLRRVMEELRRANRDLEQFAYAASHDMQEPVRMITSFMELLEQHLGAAMDQKAREYIDFAEDGAVRIKAMIDGLLAYSRVTTRGEPLTRTIVKDSFDAALAKLSGDISKGQAVITCDELPAEVDADGVQLTQLFQNLIGNAIKFRGNAQPKIHVGAKEQEEQWLFWVKDNGIGMDPLCLDKIFIIFQRLHTRTAYPGIGVGLALCRRIVERHGGRIWAESKPGEGSTFFFTLPVCGPTGISTGGSLQTSHA